LGNTNKINEFRTALTTLIAVCSRGFGGQSEVGNLKPILIGNVSTKRAALKYGRFH
jgi:hypothetical protein